MLDLTGGNLTAYLLREVSEIVGKHPRFRNSGGQVSFSNNNSITIGNVQVIVKNISTQGTRLSPDYFMCTLRGQAILAKVSDADGSFVEWVEEVNPSLIDPGVYYIVVDSVVEKSQEVTLSVQKFLWREGHVKNTQGSLVHFSAGIDTTTVAVEDGASHTTVDFTPFKGYIILSQPVDTLSITYQSNPLVPGVDFWFERQSSVVIANSTIFGVQDIAVPTTFLTVVFTDQDGYQLVQGKDYTYVTPDNSIIRLAPWSPQGSKLTATGLMKLNPNSTLAIQPENILPIILQPGQTLAKGQTFIKTSQGDFTDADVIVRTDGAIQLPVVMAPGEWYDYEVRIDTGLTEGIIAKKQSLNRLQKVVLDQNQTELSRKDVIPGVWVAIGDSVVVGDQVAIIVSPVLTETYEVFGSKENLTFTIDVKANDLMTASELSELIKAEWTFRNRDNMEADGITIFEVAREQAGESRDASGTAASYTYSLNVTAACDWKGLVPLVNRVTDVQVTDSSSAAIDFFGKITYPARLQALGTQQFIPSYN